MPGFNEKDRGFMSNEETHPMRWTDQHLECQSGFTSPSWQKIFPEVEYAVPAENEGTGSSHTATRRTRAGSSGKHCGARMRPRQRIFSGYFLILFWKV